MNRYALFLLLVLPSSLHAEIFTWKDSRGDSHFVNSIYDVPERYRAKVKKLDLGIVEKPETGQQQPAPTQLKPVPSEAITTTASPTAVTRPVTIVPARPLPPEMLRPSEPGKSDQLKWRKSRRTRSGSSVGEE